MEELRSRFDQIISVVSNFEVWPPHKEIVPKNIGVNLKVLQLHLYKEDCFVKCDKNNNINLPSAPPPIKSPTKGTKLMIPLLMSDVFSSYGRPLEMVTSFKYLGRVISEADDDWTAVV